MTARGARHEAKRRGEPTYFTGLPCKNGHMAHRRTHNGECVECYRCFKKDFYKNNQEKELARAADYRDRNRENLNAKAFEFYQANKELMRARVRDYYQRNKDVLLEKAKTIHADRIKVYTAKRYVEKKDHISRVASAYRKSNPHKVNARTAKRRASKVRATPTWVDQSAITEVYEQREAAQEIFDLKLEVDHIIPLRGRGICGLHVPWNLRVIELTRNRSKHNRYRQEDALAFVKT